MPAVWRIELADALTDRKLADIEATNVDFDRLIGKPGSLSCEVAIPDAATAELVKACDPQRTAVYVYRDADPWWSGILWHRTPSRDHRGMITVKLAAAGFESYLYRAVHAIYPGFDNGPYTNLDQFEIVRRLISEMQDTAPYMDLGLTVDSGTSGVLRTVSWEYGSAISYGEVLDELVDMVDGFEYTIDVYTSAGTRHRNVRLGYPTLGRPDIEHLIEDPGQILTWSWDEDGTRGGTVGWAQGAQVDLGATMGPIISNIMYDTPHLLAGWPGLMWVDRDPSDQSWSNVEDRGIAAAARNHGGPVVLPSVTVRLPETDITPQMLGDTVRIRISDVWHTPPLEERWRLIGIKVRPPTRDQPDETMELTLEVPRA